MSNKEFDKIWDEIYERGDSCNKYPFDSIVSTLFRLLPKLHSSEPRLLEIGCGAGNNLLFAANEGFKVYGLDASKYAIDFANEFFTKNSKQGNLQVGSFTEIPFEDSFFDVVIERAALSQVPCEIAKKAIDQVHRVLKKDGYFYSEIYSDKSKVPRKKSKNGDTFIPKGPFAGVGQIFFYDEVRHNQLLKDFTFIEKNHVERDFIVGDWKGYSECYW